MYLLGHILNKLFSYVFWPKINVPKTFDNVFRISFRFESEIIS